MVKVTESENTNKFGRPDNFHKFKNKSVKEYNI